MFIFFQLSPIHFCQLFQINFLQLSLTHFSNFRPIIFNVFASIATIRGRAKQSCLTWSGITIGKLRPPPPNVPLQFRAIQAIQY